VKPPSVRFNGGQNQSKGDVEMKKFRKQPLVTAGFAILVTALAISSARRAVAQAPFEIEPVALGEIDNARFKIEVKESIVLEQDKLTFQPGATTPWHFHPGPAFVIVDSGAVTLHTDDGCATVYQAGSAFFEKAGQVHRVSNDTEGETVIFGTLLLPVGSPPLVVAPEPEATCRGRR